MSRLDTDVVCTSEGTGPQAPGAPTLLEPRDVPLGGPRALVVGRTLPHKEIRTVGAWCFVDHFGPAAVRENGMHVPPHPHIGLQTVTWLYSGDVLHRDSLGSEQLIRPGELNLMTAGRGIAHSEDSVLPHPSGPADVGGADPSTMHGLQLWVALPGDDRHQAPHFEHHDDLPAVDLGGAVATVIMGALGPADARDAVRSPAATYSPIVGVDLALGAASSGGTSGGTSVEVPLDPAFEHGLLPVEGDVRAVDGDDRLLVPRGALLHLPPGRSRLTVTADSPARAFLLGGAPFGEQLVMWWNFVGRDHDDIAAARAAWEEDRLAAAPPGRFAPVVHPAPALPAPALPTTRLLPR